MCVCVCVCVLCLCCCSTLGCSLYWHSCPPFFHKVTTHEYTHTHTRTGVIRVYLSGKKLEKISCSCSAIFFLLRIFADSHFGLVIFAIFYFVPEKYPLPDHPKNTIQPMLLHPPTLSHPLSPPSYSSVGYEVWGCDVEGLLSLKSKQRKKRHPLHLFVPKTPPSREPKPSLPSPLSPSES